MTQQCVNCPGAEDHSTAQCPLVSAQKNELRQIITDALVSMVSGVTGLVPPSGPGQIPDFIQAPIDRAVERISASLPVGVPQVQITGHLDEVDAPLWAFIHAEAQKLERTTGSIDTYNFTRPNGAQPNGCVAVLWNGQTIHAVGLTVRDALNRTQCVRLLAAAPTVKAEQVQVSETNDQIAKVMLLHGSPEQQKEAARYAGLSAPSLPAAGSADLTAVRCQCCATEYPHDSYDVGFIAGSGMCQVCDAAMPPKDLPAAGSAVEEVEVVAWVTPEKDRAITALTEAAAREDGGAMLSSVRPYSVPCMTVAQCQRMLDQLRAVLSAQQSAQPEFCCKHSYKVAKQAAWGARDLTQCKCDHNEYCEHCWPDDFREGGKWHGGFTEQQSAPELVSVLVELAERIATHLEWDGEESLTVVQYANKCDALAGELRALLASHAEGGKV